MVDLNIDKISKSSRLQDKTATDFSCATRQTRLAGLSIENVLQRVLLRLKLRKAFLVEIRTVFWIL